MEFEVRDSTWQSARRRPTAPRECASLPRRLHLCRSRCPSRHPAPPLPDRHLRRRCWATFRPTPGVVEPDSANKQEVSQPHKDNLGSEITDGSRGATPPSSQPVPKAVPEAAVSTDDNSYRRAPLFTLPSATGGVVSLDSYLGEGNVVLVFYRGFW